MSRKPDYKFKVLNKSTELKGEIGAAWKNTDGSISVVLNPCVVLNANDDLVLNLFPQDEEKKPLKKLSNPINEKYSILRDSELHVRIFRAIEALEFVVSCGRTAAGNEQSYNAEHCEQIAGQLKETVSEPVVKNNLSIPSSSALRMRSTMSKMWAVQKLPFMN